MKMSGESLSRSALGELNHTIFSFLPETRIWCYSPRYD